MYRFRVNSLCAKFNSALGLGLNIVDMHINMYARLCRHRLWHPLNDYSRPVVVWVGDAPIALVRVVISIRVAQFIIQNSRPKLDHFFRIIYVERYFKSHKTQVSAISLNGINNQIIVISGSLRKASFTTAVCRALVGEMNAARNATAGNKIEFVLRDYVRELPTYDGDLDTDMPPAVVADIRRELGNSRAIIIGTPEYNYSLPGEQPNTPMRRPIRQ